MPLIEARDLRKTFGVGGVRHEALRGVSLDVQAGELLAIMGPSGSGKSSLLHLLGGIEPPTSGHVLLEGVDLGAMDDHQRSILRRRRIGFVFQKINLLPTLSALENVALPLLIDGVSRREAIERATEAMKSVAIEQRAANRPSQMSGGEQQRVAIARALVIRPAVILADEPTGALDTANGKRIVELLRRCVHEDKQTVIIVTHDPEVAAQADRCVHVRDGLLEVA
ncbi:MAG: ABC transporter ATP-binding protein [Planctomycetaceae bacterium]